MKKLFILTALFTCTFSLSTVFAQWQQTSLNGGSLICIAVKGDTIFAGGDNGVYLSTNNGNNWALKNTGLPPSNIGIQVLDINGDSIFAGNYVGMFLSTNNANNWTAIGLTDTSVTSIAIKGNNIFAGTQVNGVFLSTNNGSSWDSVNTGLNYSDDYAYGGINSLIIKGDTLFAGSSGNGIFFSTNNGSTWNSANTGLTCTYVEALAISGNNIFAGTSGAYGGLYLSTNSGNNWTEVASALTNTSVSSIAINDSNIVMATGAGVYLSTNNGNSWVNIGLTTAEIESLAINDSCIFAGIWTEFSTGEYQPAGVWKCNLSALTGIKELNNIASNISVYPNPATSVVYIKSTNNDAMEVCLFDIVGKQVGVSIKSNSQTTAIDVSGLSDGIYFVSIKTAGGLLNKKIVIQK